MCRRHGGARTKSWHQRFQALIFAPSTPIPTMDVRMPDPTMNLPTDINAYWNQRGRTYQREVRLAGDYHRMQETFLVDVLRLSGLPMRQLLEIGCGFGRITKVLAQGFPASAITAI